MALEEQRKSILPILVLQGPLNSLEPKTTQLSQKAQSEHWGRGASDNGRADVPWYNKFFGIYHYSAPSVTIISITHPPCQLSLFYYSQSLFFFFPFFWPAWVACASGNDETLGDDMILWTLCHSLISWDSNIFARVFFTLRAVRRQVGLWAQHSDMSFPICRRH